MDIKNIKLYITKNILPVLLSGTIALSSSTLTGCFKHSTESIDIETISTKAEQINDTTSYVSKNGEILEMLEGDVVLQVNDSDYSKKYGVEEICIVRDSGESNKLINGFVSSSFNFDNQVLFNKSQQRVCYVVGDGYNNYINIRAEGSSNSELIDTIPTGSIVLLNEDSFYIDTNDQNKEAYKFNYGYINYFDSNGNLQEGYCNIPFLSSDLDKDGNNKDLIANFDGCLTINFLNNYIAEANGETINFRSSAEMADNIIAKLESGQELTIINAENDVNNGWLLASIISSDGKEINGYISERYVTPNPELNYQYDNNLNYNYFTTDENTEVKLRAMDDSQTISILPKETEIFVVYGTNTINEKFTEIRYMEDGEVKCGYIDIQYIMKSDNLSNGTTIQTTESKSEYISAAIENIKTIDTTDEGKILLIDIWELTPDNLEKLIISGNSNSIDNFSYVPNEQISGAMIKIGASGYGTFALSDDFSIDNAYNQITKLEEYGIPYGFYYYSTCATEEEAKLELEWINGRLQELVYKNGGKELTGNVLPFTIDVEVANSTDRQLGYSMEEVTNAKIKLSELLKEQGIEETFIYTDAKAASYLNAGGYVNSERVFDLEKYCQETGDLVWAVNNMELEKQTNIDWHQSLVDAYSNLIFMEQIVLDHDLTGNETVVDFNLVNKSMLLEVLSKQIEKTYN
ncbi:MAG: hypothetical protein R3Y21_01280 [Mycoplasmatota bacterium]